MADPTGTLLNAGDVVSLPGAASLGVYPSLTVTLVGTGLTGGSVAFEAIAQDGVTAVPAPMTPLGGGTGQSSVTFGAGNVAQIWRGEAAGAAGFRVRCAGNLGATLSVWVVPSLTPMRGQGGGGGGAVFAAPEDYGARGDGAADDTAAVRAALAAGRAVALTAGKVYRVTGTLDLAAGQPVLGNGARILADFNQGGTSNQAILRGQAVADVSLADFTVDGNAAVNTTARLFGLWLKGACAHVRLRGVTFQNIPDDVGTGINGGDGVYLGPSTTGANDGPTDVTVEACRFTNVKRMGLSVVAGRRITLQANTFNGINCFGVDLEPNALADLVQNVSVLGNRFANCGQTSNTTLSAGCVQVSGQTSCRRVKIVGNDMEFTPDASPGTLTSTFNAVQLAAGSGGEVEVIGNDVTGGYYGINVNAPNCSVAGNRVTGARRAVGCRGDFAVITGNPELTGWEHGVYGQANDCVLGFNTFLNCGTNTSLYVVNFVDGWARNTVVGNRARDTQAGGAGPTTFLRQSSDHLADWVYHSNQAASLNAGNLTALAAFGPFTQGDLARTLFATTSTAVVANTTTESTLLGGVGASGSKTIPANWWQPGRSLDVEAWGYYSALGTGQGNLTVNLKLGATVVGGTGAQPAPAAAVNWAWHAHFKLTCRAVGVSGTVQLEGEVDVMGAATGAPSRWPVVKTGATTVDTTAAMVLDVTATWSVANASNTIAGAVGHGVAPN